MYNRVDRMLMISINNNVLNDIRDGRDVHHKTEYSSYDEFAALRNKFVKGNLTEEETMDFLSKCSLLDNPPYDSLTTAMANVLYDNLIVIYDEDDYNFVYPSSERDYEEFEELCDKFLEGEMTEGEMADFFVEYNVGEPSDYNIPTNVSADYNTPINVSADAGEGKDATINKMEKILMDVIYENNLSWYDEESEWDDLHSDDENGVYYGTRDYNEFLEQRAKFKSGEMDIDEMKKFLNIETGSSPKDVMSSFISRKLLNSIDSGDWIDIHDEKNKSEYPSYEDFINMRDRFTDGEMSEREVKDFLVECSMADPFNYAPGWYYSSDGAPDVSLDVSPENIVRGGMIEVEMEEYGGTINCCVDKDGIHNGKVSARIIDPGHKDYGKRIEAEAGSIRKNMGYMHEEKAVLEMLEGFENDNRKLVAKDGTVISENVLKGCSIDFNMDGEKIHGVIMEDFIHDGKISAASVTTDYGKRYEVPKDDVTDITNQLYVGYKQYRQYNAIVKDIGLNEGLSRMVTESIFDTAAQGESPDDGRAMYGFVVDAAEGMTALKNEYLQQVFDDVAGMPEDSSEGRSVYLFDVEREGVMDSGSRLYFIGCKGYGPDIKYEIADAIEAETHSDSIMPIRFTDEMESMLIKIEKNKKDIDLADIIKANSKSEILNDISNEKLNEGLVTDNINKNADLQMQ